MVGDGNGDGDGVDKSEANRRMTRTKNIAVSTADTKVGGSQNRLLPSGSEEKDHTYQFHSDTDWNG